MKLVSSLKAASPLWLSAKVGLTLTRKGLIIGSLNTRVDPSEGTKHPPQDQDVKRVMYTP